MNAVFHLRRRAVRAFTLVEMLVVIAIIAILLGALLPALSGAQNAAKNAAVVAQLTALDTGLTLYRSESSLGGGFPPSSSDQGRARQRIQIANPRQGPGYTDGGNNGGGASAIDIAGAHLLVYAMMGVDGLGTAGFRDTDKDGKWFNDLHDGTGGLYEIDQTTGKEKFPRYGAPGYVDDKMREKTESMTQLIDDGIVVNENYVQGGSFAVDELMFVDAWDRPILYYKANPSARYLVGDTTRRGVYWQEDNAVITGSDGTAGTFQGLDFGQGALEGETNVYHEIAVAPTAPVPTQVGFKEVGTNSDYENSFARFILDPRVSTRPTPVKKDSYLLISAGLDGVYGSEDDLTNWARGAAGGK
jgi:prepilin-type N-terminal cleavage/methylation domain-containing protein